MSRQRMTNVYRMAGGFAVDYWKFTGWLTIPLGCWLSLLSFTLCTFLSPPLFVPLFLVSLFPLAIPASIILLFFLPCPYEVW